VAGRAALLPAGIPTPRLGGPGVPDWLGVYATYRLTQLQVFVEAIGDLFLIASGLSVLGAFGALLLRFGPAPAAPAGFAPPTQATEPSSPNGEVPIGRHLMPSATATGNSSPARLADEPVDAEAEADDTTRR
jgi:hypothetical protein